MLIPKILTWNDRFALIDRFQPDDKAIIRIFSVSNTELRVARRLRTSGTFIAAKNLDYNSYASAFSSNPLTIRRPMSNNNTTNVTSITMPETATKKQQKRGRKGSNIVTAFKAVPGAPIDATSFAKEHKVSIAVLRQSKRFDPDHDNSLIRVKKDKSSGKLMIWRESSKGK